MPRSTKKGPAGGSQQTETVDEASRVMPGIDAPGIEQPVNAETVYASEGEASAAAEAPINPYDIASVPEGEMPENLTPAQEAVLELNSYYKWGAENYHFKTEAGTARVKTESIRRVAAVGKDTIDQIKELIQSMTTYVAASDEYWRGDAGDHFREGFALGMKDLAKCLDDHEEYIRELIAYADKYEGVITQANAIANSLNDVIWEDVGV